MSDTIHICPVCDYVYETDPDATIPFDELPEEYLCPACSVEKSWFEIRVI